MAFRTSNLVDVAAQFLSSILGRGCYLALQAFLARSLGPRDFGLYAIGWTVAGLVGTVAPLGMPQAVLRYGMAGRRSLRAAPVAIAMAVGLVCLAVILLSAGPVARGVFGEPHAAPVIAALAPSIPLLGIFSVLSAALRASHANLASAAVGALVFALYLAATMIAFGNGASAVVAGHMYSVAILLTLLPTAWLLHRRPSGPVSPPLWRLAQFGVVTMFIHSANVLNLLADRIVIGIMADARAVGAYQVASQLAMVVIVLRAAVITVFEARVPKVAPVGGTVPDVTREFLAASRLLLHASAPGLVCLVLTAGFWIRALFGPAYPEATLPLAILAIGQLGLTFTGPSVNALHMTGEERRVMRLTVGTCLMNLLGNVALVPVLGLAGAAVASAIANITVSTACLARLLRTRRLHLSFAAIGDIVAATAACAAVTALAASWLGTSSFLAAGSLLVAGYAVYAGVVALLCRVEDEALSMAGALLRRALRAQPLSRLPTP